MMSHRAIALLLFACVSLPGFLGFRNPTIADAYTQEWDLIERMSAGVWFIATAWCLVAAFLGPTHKREWMTGSMFFFLLGFRELDGHIWLTGWNLDKLALYWNPSIPFHQRFLILCLGLTLLWWVLSVFPFPKWKTLWMNYRSKVPWTKAVLLWMFILVTTMLLDKSVYLPMYHETPFQHLDIVRGVFEESLELTLGVYTLFLLFPLWVQVVLFPHQSIAK